MHDNGYNLPEMNEYDKRVELPKTHTRFDASFYWREGREEEINLVSS